MRDILQRNSWLNFVTSVFRRATNAIKFFYDYLNFRRFLENQNNVADEDGKELTKLSENTFLQETDDLKQKTAGAGLTDND